MFKYEPSFAHTSRTFNARMDARMKEAKKDQEALLSAERMAIAEGSVNPALATAYPEDQWELFDAPGG